MTITCRSNKGQTPAVLISGTFYRNIRTDTYRKPGYTRKGTHYMEHYISDPVYTRNKSKSYWVTKGFNNMVTYWSSHHLLLKINRVYETL